MSKLTVLLMLLAVTAGCNQTDCGAYYDPGKTYYVKVFPGFKSVTVETIQKGLDYWAVLGYDFRVGDQGYSATIEPMSEWYAQQGFAGLGAAAPGQIMLRDESWLEANFVAHEIGHLLGVPHQDIGDCNVMANSACYRDDLSELDIVAWTRRVSWCPDPVPTPVR